MKTAFISDVHGNLEAFTAVCESIKNEHVDRDHFSGRYCRVRGKSK